MIKSDDIPQVLQSMKYYIKKIKHYHNLKKSTENVFKTDYF